MMPFHVYNNELPSIWLLGAITSCIAFAGLVFYRLYLHPLSNFPGPRLAAATHWYEAYFELVHNGGSLYAAKIRQLHAEYGPVVRINPNEISVNDAQFHDELYAPHPAIRYKDPALSALLGTNNGSFGTSDHYLHRQRRVAYNPFFASANVAAAEQIIKHKVNHLCDLLWSRRADSPNIRTYLAAISFDSFFTMAFGRPLDLLDNLALAEEFNSTVELLATSPPVYKLFPSLLILQAAERFGQDERDGKVPVSRSKSVPETLFSVIKRSKIADEEKTSSRMSHEGVEMFMATYTSGRTMLAGLYYLHANPDVLDTLRKELGQAYAGPTDELSFKTLNTLPYLRAVVKEILRVSFPVGSRIPMICHDTMTCRDWDIPAHTSISVNHRNLLFDPEVFEEPYAFRPERWLDKSNPIDEKRYFVVFGKGARGCPGKEYSMQLIQFTLATLVQRFEFQLSDETSFERDVKVARESLVTAPSSNSQGIKLSIIASRG
ncbi:hypothetical protein VMCG_10851 [Cytospora schulzeri]|uniref:Cytochrome P450 n=1 Tax=Cytospora schulzeri TaxID=448051 RepID=A0A423V7N2_9PEZI|nr:hypothetical protein VMCG_10851 [Valsa malicola]